MGRVFISYRRDDSETVAGRLRDRLVEALGEDRVFKDVDSIALGDDFRDALVDAVGRSDLVLVLIGPKWLDAPDAEGRRRLDDPADYVRKEIEWSLVRKVVVVPVLLGATKMPEAAKLPEPLKPLAVRQATRLREDPDFAGDVQRILRRVPGEKAPRVFWLNVALLVAIPVLASLWMLAYTDWLSGLQAGTAWAVLAAVAGLVFKGLRGERTSSLLVWLDEAVLTRRGTAVALASVAAALLGLACFVGSVRLEVDKAWDDREFHVHAPGAPSGRALRPHPGQSVHAPRWTIPGAPREVLIAATGLPPRHDRIRWWGILKPAVPESFLRPTVLVRCAGPVIARTAAKPPANRSLVLRLIVDGVPGAPVRYTGRTAWVGSEGESPLPPEIARDWQEELEGRSRDEASVLKSSWLETATIPVDLRAGQTLAAEVLWQMPDGQTLPFASTNSLTIEAPTVTRWLPQVLTLQVNPDN